jgi:hypothetical protein
LPPSLAGLETKAEKYFPLENSYESLKEFILKQ